MNESLINALQRLVGPKNVLLGPKIADYFLSKIKTQESLEAEAVVFPNSNLEVEAILLICHNYGQQSLVLYKGWEQLDLFTKTDGGEIIISLDNFNNKEL